MEDGRLCGATGCDSIIALGRANILPRDWGLVPFLEEMIQPLSTILESLQGVLKRATIFDSRFGIPLST